MPVQRCCYSLMSRPATINLIRRFISKSNGFNQRRLPRERNKSGTNVEMFSSTILSEYTEANNYRDTLQSKHNLKNENITSSCHVPQIISNLPSQDSLDDRDITLPHPLETSTEDLSDIGPYLTPTFTFAKYANKSRTVQELVKLGVNLYKIESMNGMVEYILKLDFERDVKPYIRFLHDCGVPANTLGDFLTKNPYIFKVDMDDLRTRIRYLRAHEFNINMIQTIICKHPNWLMYNTKVIDGRLGYFQSNFKLSGNEVRTLTVKAPKVVTYSILHLMANTLTIKEDMDFNQKQRKQLLLTLPKIWVKNRERLFAVFEYVHNEMQLQRDFIVRMPQILLCRKNRLRQRHLFLIEMKKAQYDPSKPMYVSPRALVSGTDAEFCINIAKTSVNAYNAFLKTF
ncbi:transcription termination factor 3, mitochondrial [Nylanderia fulva]|uniref:transcription termination factor 3, mitochondrial n=1 Tax=Nylanderia fulva TaxID=613905 RepID=UPI0010FB66A1|nr:transcription termination factor 3, mitochondrial [Nylanderia fulva]